MAENRTITCPHCGESFELEAGAYYDILSQVRDAAFQADLDARVRGLTAGHAAELQKLRAEHAAELARARGEAQAEIMKRDQTLAAALSECETKLRIKDEEVAAYRDFKARQSTKMIGESLERYCSDAFDKVRAMAFPDAYFEKDNKVSAASGSKGDFIFRDFAPDGTELVSIMFEMKNEADGTEKKHRNTEFFRELDKDRNEKGCEYAILVTLLEADSDLYNQGIVDVSHRYPKMYVIRPQFFIPVISFLRNAALQRMALQDELKSMRAEHADVLRFERDLDAFKSGFRKNHELAGTKLETAVAEIDKAIRALEKTRAALTASQTNMKLAGDRVDGLSLTGLSDGNPTVQAMVKKARAGSAKS